MSGRGSVRSSVARLVVGWLTVLSVIFGIGVALPTPHGEAATIESYGCYTTGDGAEASVGSVQDTFVTFTATKDDSGTPADPSDDLYSVSGETAPGGANSTGTFSVETIAIRPGGTSVYGNGGAIFTAEHHPGADGTYGNADDVAILGNLDASTGVFARVHATNNVGIVTTSYASGVPNAVIVNPAFPTDPTNILTGQELKVDDIDGLTFDHQTGKLWGVVRVVGGGNNSPADQLIIIDPSTGRFIPDQFVYSGSTYDSVPVVPDGTTIANNNTNAYDIDDLAIDPSTGILYGVANSSGSGDMLVTIDKVTGVMSLVGTMGVNDVEGLGFSNVGQTFGDFFATTGNATGTATDDDFYVVNTSTGAATSRHSFTATTDLESMDCLSSDVRTHTVSGYVFLDANKDGINGEDLNGNGILDAGEDGTNGFAVNGTLDRDTGQADVEVRLFHDKNDNGAADATTPDVFLDQIVTAANGYYEFLVAIPVNPSPAVPLDFALDIISPVTGAPAHPVLDRPSTLPGGSIMTTDLQEEASFTGAEAGDTTERSNDFGFVTAPNIAKTSSNVTAPNTTDPILPGTDTIEYQIVIHNNSASDITTNIDVTDTLPAGLVYTGTSNSTLGDPGDLTIVETDDGTVGTPATPTFLADGEFQTGSLGIRLDRLDAGHSVTITFRATTANAGITSGSITNTACRLYNAETVCDSETDSVVGSIGDFVWRDEDMDTIQDGGTETGIGSIAVTLLSSPNADCTDGDQTTVVQAGLTNPVDTSAGGLYSFARLATGFYCVDVDGTDANMPAGYSLTGAQTDPRLVEIDVADTTKRIITTADFGYGPAPVIDLELSKTVDDATPSVGDSVTFTLSLLNNNATATVQATGVTVTDVLPAGLTYDSHTVAKGSYDSGTGVWTVGTMTIGESTSMTITATVGSEGTHVNKAQVTADNENDTDSTPNNRTFPGDDPVEDDEASASVTTPAAPPPPDPDPQFIDVELTKDVSKINVEVGEEFTYTVTVTNATPGANSVAMNVRVTDQLPDDVSYVSHTASKGEYDPATGLWSIGSLRRSEAHTLSIVAKADRPGQYVNVAYVSEASGDDVDSTPGSPNSPYEDDEDDARIQAGLIDLELTKDVSDGTVTIGEEFTFDISVANVAVDSSPPTPATEVEVADALPDGLRIVRVSSTTGAFDTETFIWFVGDMDVGESATLSLVVVADREGTFVNVAQVSAATGKDVDSTPGNDVPGEDDQDDAVVVVMVRGSIGDYVWLDRNGDGIQDDDEFGIPGVFVAIAGPFNSRPASVGTIEAADSRQTDADGRYLFQELGPGFYIVVVMEDTVPGGLTNTLGTTWYEVNIGPGASYVDADFGYQPMATELSIIKAVTPSGRVSFSDEPVYTITVTNTGGRTLTNVVVTDTAPFGTTYRPGTTTLDGQLVADVTGAADPIPLHPDHGGITLGDLRPGDSRTITFGVTVNFQEPREIPNVAEVSSTQTGVIKSNQVVIEPGIDTAGGALPATGGPFDRLLLLAGGAIALGVVALWAVREPGRRRRGA